MSMLEKIGEGILNHIGLKILAVLCCLFLSFLAISAGLIPALGFAMLPFIICFLIICLKHPYISFLFLFTVCFFIMGAMRYIRFPLPAGIIVDIVILFNFIVIAINHNYRSYNPTFKLPVFFLISMCWTVYCLVQIFNPDGSLSNWVVTIRSIALYICLFQFLVYYIFTDYNKVRYFLLFWGSLALFAALKAIGQKYIGFDTNETIWLYTLGAHTHVIYSGIRFFSFFTDAANFGCHMGMAMVVFSILSFYEKVRLVKVFFIIVAISTMYGMFISGTRSAIAIPFAGYAFYILLLKRWQLMIFGGFVLLVMYCFFAFTTIGSSNADIRRMRTAFQFTEDASFIVRQENQQKMKEFMGGYPIGLGIGTAKHSEEGDLLHGLPTDTSLVFIWVETGVIGLTIYLLVWFSCLAICFYYVWFKLKDPEVRAICTAAAAGIAGMAVAGYGNEVLHQFPTGQTIYILMAIAMICPYLERNKNHGREIH